MDVKKLAPHILQELSVLQYEYEYEERKVVLNATVSRFVSKRGDVCSSW
jgi:predicted choloylglycine hydrolase